METDTLVFPTGSLILMRFNIDATGSRNRELLNGSKKRDGFIQRTKDPISHLTGATTIFGPLLVLSQRTIRPANEKEWPMLQAIFLEADREYAIQPADLYCGIRS